PNLPRVGNPEGVTKSKKSNPTKFVNIARISMEKGTLKLLEILQHVKHDLILDLYGPIYDEAYWGLCKLAIEKLPANIHVTYKGIVPSENVPILLEQYDYFVLLSEGENFGHAILEAFMAGCPVIISDQTPWKNLESKGIGWDIDIDNVPKAILVFEKAIGMPDTDYTLLSDSAKQFSKKFSENPELIMLNLKLFDL